MTTEHALLLLACILAPVVTVIAVKVYIWHQDRKAAEHTAMKMLSVSDNPSVRAARFVR